MRPVRSLLATAVAATTAVTAVSTLAPAHAGAGDDSWDVPADARIVVDGGGWGHGNGMSQYGARGAAQAGKTYREIVEFYYPGTGWGTARGRIKVLLTADDDDTLEVAAKRGLSVRSRATNETWELPSRPDRWRLVDAGRDRTKVQKPRRRRDGWRTWRRVPGDAEFRARGAITLLAGGDRTAYPGHLRSVSVGNEGRDRATVNVVGLESYLKGVVPDEMPTSWEPDAVRAQAIAARTYAAFERRDRDGWFDVYDTTASQVYGGKDAREPGGNAAVRATRREILTWDGAPAFTQFSSSNGGWTSSGGQPYLVAQEDPYDGRPSAGNPNHEWTATLDDERIEREWDLGNLTQIEVLRREGGRTFANGGRVESVRLHGSQRDVTVTGDDFRYLLGLKSTYLTFRVEDASPRRPAARLRD